MKPPVADHTIHPAIRPRRLTVSGGAQLREENARFCWFLGRRLLQEPQITIITGGLAHLKNQTGLKCADWATIEGVLSCVAETGADPSFRVETLLPEEKKDWGDVGRFCVGRTVRLHGRTPQARRFTLVNTADVILTIEGVKGTCEIIDLALVIGKPVLPLPFTKGVSREKWHENRDEICRWFDISNEVMMQLESTSLEGMDDTQLTELADLVVRQVVRGMRRRCFVMMPFSEKGNALYDSVICQAVEELGIAPVRTDRLNLTGDALETLRHAILSCDGALADITGSNPNVMYELGLVHAQNKPVVIICELGERDTLGTLPFDLRNHHVIGYGPKKESLKAKLQASLALVFGEQPS